MDVKKIRIGIALIAMIGLVGCSIQVSNKEGSEEKTKEEIKNSIAAIGEVTESDGLKITVNSTRIDKGLFEANDGKILFVIDVTLENTTDKSYFTSSIMNFHLKDSEGRQLSQSFMANLNGSLDTTIPPYEKVSGEIAYSAPTEGELIFSFTPILEKAVRIKVR